MWHQATSSPGDGWGLRPTFGLHTVHYSGPTRYSASLFLLSAVSLIVAIGLPPSGTRWVLRVKVLIDKVTHLAHTVDITNAGARIGGFLDQS